MVVQKTFLSPESHAHIKPTLEFHIAVRFSEECESFLTKTDVITDLNAVDLKITDHSNNYKCIQI